MTDSGKNARHPQIRLDGSDSPAVMGWVVERLLDHNPTFMGTEDVGLLSATRQAVRNLQLEKGLLPTGLVDEDVQQILECAVLKRPVLFEEFINHQGFEYFQGSEFTGLFKRSQDGVSNGVPPEDLWDNIIPTLRVLDELRRRFEAPIVISSAYRNEAYNKVVGGKWNSQHRYNRALDFSCAYGTPEQWANTLRSMRGAFIAEGEVFHGGIGTYATFVHVDTRGVDADW